MPIPPKHRQVLRRVYEALQGGGVKWVLTGSMGLALRGLPLTPGDIDIQTDAAGAYEIEKRLAPFVEKPVSYSSTEQIRSHFGKVMIDGIRVEIMGDIQHRLEKSGWTSPADLGALAMFAVLEDMQIPVLPLEYEYRAYLELGRTEKAQLIRQYIEKDQP
ncbi:MAG: hypothetical protein JXB47_01170 [Anaerolineae bacterium]|nr:hypothetical protein [Anaerolineae bacterium]